MSEMVLVPDGWEVEKLGKFVKLVGGFAFKSEDRVSDGIRWLKIANVGINEIKWDELDYLPIEFKVQYKNFILNENDIVIAMTRPLLGDKLKISKISKFDSNSLLNQRVGKFIFSENVNKDFMYFLLQHSDFIMNLMLRIIGTDPPNVGSEDVESIILPIPKEKKEQEKIAKILSTLDKAIESTNRLIEKEKHIKTALMQELLTNGIDKNGQIRTKATHSYKESELGLIPDEWEVVSLDQCSTITNSNVDKKSSPEEQEIKLCNYMDVYVNDEIDNSIDFMVATATELEIKKFTLKKDDVIITKDSESPDDIGIPSYVAEDLKDVICGYHLTMIRPKKNCYGKYLALLLQGNYYKKYFGKLASGSTRFALSLGTISQALIALPSITEQKQIAKILTTQDKKIQTEEITLAKLKELKKGVMNDLLSAKVRVKI